MTTLSPAAQAQKVLDAVRKICPAPTDKIAVAAILAAVDQVVPVKVRVRKGMRPGGVGSTTPDEWMQDQRLHTRRHFLAIAAELEVS